MGCMRQAIFQAFVIRATIFLVVSAFVFAKTSQNTVVAVRTLRAPNVLQYAIL